MPTTEAGLAFLTEPDSHTPRCRRWSLGMDAVCDCNLAARLVRIEAEARIAGYREGRHAVFKELAIEMIEARDRSAALMRKKP